MLKNFVEFLPINRDLKAKFENWFLSRKKFKDADKTDWDLSQNVGNSSPHDL